MRLRIIAVAVILLAATTANGQAKKSRTHECGGNDDSSFGAFSFSGSGTGTSYICKEGKWVEDVEGEKRAREKAEADNKKKKALYWALRTRILTDAEMGEVANYDYELLKPTYAGSYATMGMIGVDPDEAVKKEFMVALLQQFKLRAAAQTPVLIQQPCGVIGSSPVSGTLVNSTPIFKIVDH